MGKLHRRYNWKSRQQTEQVERPTVHVELELDVQKGKFDASNAFVLPSKKEKTKTLKNKIIPPVKPLSKKQRKRLEQKRRRQAGEKQRKQLFEDLQKVQATKEELVLLTSVSQMQTTGVKRFLSDGYDLSPKRTKVNSIKGANKKKAKLNQSKILHDEVSPSSSDTDSSDIDDTSEFPEESVAVTEEFVDNNDEESENKILESSSPISSTNKTKEVEIMSNSSGEKNEKSEEMLESEKNTEQKNETESKQSPTSESFKTQYVSVHRTPEIQKSRLSLPILPEEQVVMEAINENPVVVICGPTGSGKTTQVPQFLYEAGYTMEKGIIGITEPRRVAAITMSQRVAHEMNLSSKEVSYQIRFQGNVTKDTKIKFMTDGVLKKEIEKDFLLTNYKVIVIDEAHERTIHSDILIGLLSGIQRIRMKRGNPLKFVIMSATLRIEDFTENRKLFKIPPPVIKIDSRQYPVHLRFKRQTPTDYLGDAYKKVCQIHQKLPAGGILVFVTGSEEVKRLCYKLQKTFPYHPPKEKSESQIEETPDDTDDADEMKSLKHFQKQCKKSKDKKSNFLPDINLDEYPVEAMDEEMLLDEVESDDDFDELMTDDESENLISCIKYKQPLYVLPLYSLLSPHKQAMVFQPPPENTRLCVVATNVAETSLTIPNIKYVVDTGKVKTRVYDKISGISTFVVTWTSKASANQRAGRAGRTGTGYCYRLYSTAVFNDEFPKFSPPEITLRPIDDIMLHMKAIGIKDIINFPFPTPPDLTAVKSSEERLVLLGALEKREIPLKKLATSKWRTEVTDLGRIMAYFSIIPRYAKMIIYSQEDVMPYTIAVIAALSVREIFLDNRITEDTDDQAENTSSKKRNWKNVRQQWAGSGSSLYLGDVMVLLQAVGTTECEGCSEKSCLKYGVRHKAMIEIRKLRRQLTNEVNVLKPQLNLPFHPKMSPPSNSHIEFLRRLVLHGVPDHVARRILESEIKGENKHKWKNAYQCLDIEEPVFIHPDSVLGRHTPEFVVYQDIFETSKLYMRVVTAIEPEWLPLFAPQLCNISKPLDDPPSRYCQLEDEIFCHVNSTFGREEWPLPVVEIKYPNGTRMDKYNRYRWFARFFLEGKVVTSLEQYNKYLLSTAATMFKPWASLKERKEKILQALASKEIDSKKRLLDVWKTEPQYLLEEYCKWLPEHFHNEVSKKWPPSS